MSSGELGTRIYTTQQKVICIPLTVSEAGRWAITVEYRSPGKWAVLFDGDCLGRDGLWTWEPSPSNRTDQWLEDHRFTEPEALGLAASWAPLVEINGMTAPQWFEHKHTKVQR